jgi:hypothetical protein
MKLNAAQIDLQNYFKINACSKNMVINLGHFASKETKCF